MIDVSIGDWVLMEHPYIYDRFVVRQIVHVTPHTVTVAHYRDPEYTGKRKRLAIVGIFQNEAAARRAPAILQELSIKLIQDEKALRAAHNAAAKALING